MNSGLTMEELAQKLVLKSSGDEVPAAALPSLVAFMQAVAEHAASQITNYQGFAPEREIRSAFGLSTSPAFLLQKPRL